MCDIILVTVSRSKEYICRNLQMLYFVFKQQNKCFSMLAILWAQEFSCPWFYWHDPCGLGMSWAFFWGQREFPSQRLMEGYFQGPIKALLENHTLLFTEILLLSQVPPWVHSERQPRAVWKWRPEKTFWLKAPIPHVREELDEASCPAPKDFIRDFKGQKVKEKQWMTQPGWPSHVTTTDHQGLQHGVHRIQGASD